MFAERTFDIQRYVRLEAVHLAAHASVICATALLLGCTMGAPLAFGRSLLLGLGASLFNLALLSRNAVRLAAHLGRESAPSGNLRRAYASSGLVRYGALFLGLAAFGKVFPLHIAGLAAGLLSVQAAALTRSFAGPATGRG